MELVLSSDFEIYFNGDIIIEIKKKALGEINKYQAGNVVWIDGSKLSQENVEAIAS